MFQLSEKAREKKREYDVAYAKKNFKCKNLAFNKLYPEDIALLDWINSQPENGTKYIKRLIREDMERRQQKED